MKIAVISFGTSDYEIGKYTKKINKEYCRYNNYNFSYLINPYNYLNMENY